MYSTSTEARITATFLTLLLVLSVVATGAVIQVDVATASEDDEVEFETLEIELVDTDLRLDWELSGDVPQDGDLSFGFFEEDGETITITGGHDNPYNVSDDQQEDVEEGQADLETPGGHFEDIYEVEVLVFDDDGEVIRSCRESGLEVEGGYLINGCEFDVEVPGFNADITEEPENVTVGETVSVETEITNTGDESDTQEINLLDFDDNEVDTTSLTLDEEESQSVTLEWETTDGDSGSGPLTVETQDAEIETRNITVSDDVSTSDGDSESDSVDDDDGITVDENLTISGGPFEDGFVAISEGFDPVSGDTLTVDSAADTTPFDSIEYGDETGLLTVEPDGETATADEFEQLFRNVTFEMDRPDTQDRELTFRLRGDTSDELTARYSKATDRYYEWVEDSDISWEDAREAAINEGGHLATIRSEAENEFIRNALPGSGWIGGYAVEGSDQIDWHWIDETDGERGGDQFFEQTGGHVAWTGPFPDPPAGIPGGGDLISGEYENWDPRHQPDRKGPIKASQTYTYLCAGDTCPDGMWKDGNVSMPGFTPSGYIVEYDENPRDEDDEVVDNRTVSYVAGTGDPSADAAPSHTVDAGETFTLDGSGSSDATYYDWDLDGKTTLTGETNTTSLEQAGEYTVTLTVTDEEGNTDTDITTVTVENTDSPDAHIEAPATVERGESFLLDATGSTDAVAIESIEWGGDGPDSTAVARHHGYNETGQHTIEVTVTDEAGNTDTEEHTIDVESSDRPDITAVETTNPSSGAVDFTISSDTELDSLTVELLDAGDITPRFDDSNALVHTIETDDFDKSEENGEFTYTNTTDGVSDGNYVTRLVEATSTDDGDGAYWQQDTVTVGDTINPEFEEATITDDDPHEILVEFTDPVEDGGDSTDAFTFDGVGIDVTDLREESSNIVLELDGEAVADEEYNLTYQDGHTDSAIQSSDDGSAAVGFEEKSVTNNIDPIEPTFEDATIFDPDELLVEFSDPIDGGDSADAFELDAIGDSTAVSIIDLREENDDIVLELDESVSANDEYTLSYDGGHAEAAIQSSDDGSDAVGFTDEAVTNDVDGTNPEFEAATVTDGDPDEVLVEFSDSIEDGGDSTGAFELDPISGAADRTVTGVSEIGGDLVLFLDGDVVANDDYELSYDGNDGDIRSSDDESDAVGFTDELVDNQVDPIEPEYESAVVDEPATEIEVTFGDDVSVLDESSAIDETTVTVSGTEQSVTGIERSATDEITVTLDEKIEAGETVELSYNGNQVVSDVDNSVVESFTVDSSVDSDNFDNDVSERPVFVAGYIDTTTPDELELEFDQEIDVTGGTDGFDVAIDGQQASVSSVEESTPETNVTVTIAEAIEADETVTVSYDGESDTLDGEGGGEPEAFTASSDDEDLKNGVEPASFVVSFEDIQMPVVEDRELDVTVVVENEGGSSDTQAIELLDFDGETADSTHLSVDRSDDQETTLTWDTDLGDAGEGYLEIGSEDDNETSELLTIDEDEPPTADAGTDITVGSGEEIEFDGANSTDDFGIDAYEWDLTGNGTTDATGETVTHSYEEDGEYTVALTVEDTVGQTDTDELTVQVVDETVLVANAGGNYTTNESESVILDGSESEASAGIDAYEWDLTDDGTADATGETVEETYQTPGTYPVTLTVVDEEGNTVETTTYVEVLDVTDPVADAGGDETVTVGEEIQFDGSNSTDNVGVDSYSWDLGDGTTATGPEPTHTYTETGEYTVELLVADEAGNTDTDELSVTVEPEPEPNFLVNITDTNTPVVETADLEVTANVENTGEAADAQMVELLDFENEPVDAVGISLDSGEEQTVDLTWDTDLGDNGSGILTLQTANDSATSNVLDIESNDPPVADAGSDITVGTDEQIEFDGSDSTDEFGIDSYEWDFGDSTTETGDITTHTYQSDGEYTVELTVTDTVGQTGTDTITVNVLNDSVLVANGGGTYSVGDGQSLTLDGSDSEASAGIESYEWDFTNDGSTDATGAQVSHVYDTPGTYTVGLTVTDQLGNTASTTTTVDVADTTDPVADAGENKTAQPDEQIQFDGTDSTDNTGIDSYIWDFGDGTSATGPTPTHSYDGPGAYTAELTVVDEAGNSDSDEITVDIVETSEALSAEAGPDRTVTAGERVTFDGGESAPEGEIESYDWDFDDGTTGSGQTVTHTYSEPGEYTATLTVTNQTGETETDELTVTVEPAEFSANASANSYVVSVDSTVELRGTDSTVPEGIAADYDWHDPTGTVETSGERATHHFEKPGEYDVELTVSGGGTTASDSMTITVVDNTAPVARLDAPETVRNDTTVTLDGTNSTDNVAINSYEWDFGPLGSESGADRSALTQQFDQPGEYPITLTVSDTSGNTDTNSTTVSVVAPSGTVSPDELDFGTLSVGSSQTKQVSVTNDGTAPLLLSEIDLAGDEAFGINGDHSEQIVAPGQTSQFSVTFDPQANGTKSGTLWFTRNDTETREQIDLQGAGIESDLEPVESAVEFGAVEVGNETTASVTIENTGAEPANLQETHFTGNSMDFDTVDDQSTVPAGEGKTVDVTFEPTAVGDRAGSLEFITETNETVSVSLQGVGNGPAISLETDSASFGTVGVNRSATRTIQLTNAGDRTLDIGNIHSRSGSTAFAVDDATVPETLEPGETEQFDIEFEPERVGNHEGTIIIDSNAPGENRLDVDGRAVGAGIAIDRENIDFGTVEVGDTVSMTLTVWNKHNSKTNLTVEETDIVGTDPEYFSVTDGNPPVTLEPGEQQEIEVSFEQRALGEKDAQLQIHSNAANRPLINVWLANSHSYILVNEISNPTVNVAGFNLVADNHHTVNVETPSAAAEPVTVENANMSIVSDGNFEMNISNTATPAHEFESDSWIPVQYLEADNTDDVNDVVGETELRYRVNKSALPASATEDDVVIHRFDDGDWTDLSAQPLERTDEEIVYTTETKTVSDFVVSASDPTFEEGNLTITSTETTDSVTAGETVAVDVSLENPGDGAVTETVELSTSESGVVDSEPVTLDTNETDQRSLTWETASDEKGSKTLTIETAQDSATVEIEALSSDGQTEESAEKSDDETEDETSPFVFVVVGVAFLALVVVGVVLRSRRQSKSGVDPLG